MSETEEIIFEDSDKAATFSVELNGWVDRHGTCFGDDEYSARLSGATHVRCGCCGKPLSFSYMQCEDCYHVGIEKEYSKLQKKVWEDKSIPLTMYDGDIFFYSTEELQQYCDLHETSPDKLLLMLCEPIIFPGVYRDIWDDYYSSELNLPIELEAALEEFNCKISEFNKTNSECWVASEYAVVVPELNKEKHV